VDDVQYALVSVDDDRAASDVAGKSCPAGRVVGPVQDGKQAGQGLSLVRVPSQVAVEGRADVGAGDRHVNTSEKQGKDWWMGAG
jgi:hypothetical protein